MTRTRFTAGRAVGGAYLMETNRFFDGGLPPVLWLLPLTDLAPGRLGFDVRSEYVETLWLPVLGPSATWLVRRLGTLAAAFPQGTWVDSLELGVSMGLGEGRGLLTRGLRRLVMFSVAECDNGDVLRVRCQLRPVGARSLERLSSVLVAEHHRLVSQLRSRAAA